jgi:hypothetical protein
MYGWWHATLAANRADSEGRLGRDLAGVDPGRDPARASQRPAGPSTKAESSGDSDAAIDGGNFSYRNIIRFLLPISRVLTNLVMVQMTDGLAPPA